MKQSPWRSDMYWLVPLAFSAYFLIQPMTTCSGLTPTEWAQTPHVNHKCHPDMLTGQSDDGHYLIGVLSTQVTLVCVRMTKAIQHSIHVLFLLLLVNVSTVLTLYVKLHHRGSYTGKNIVYIEISTGLEF